MPTQTRPSNTPSRVRGIPGWEATLRWDEFCPLVEKVINRGDHEWSTDDILEKINQSEMQLWACEDDELYAMGITQISKYPKKKYLEYVMAASNRHMGFKFWRSQMIIVDQWGKQHGCNIAKITGRRGWGRALGWKPACTVFKREI